MASKDIGEGECPQWAELKAVHLIVRRNYQRFQRLVKDLEST